MIKINFSLLIIILNMKKDKEYNKIVFKIITIGDSYVGKTSIIRRYIDNIFENFQNTIGISKFEKEITLKNKEKIYLSLTDTSGQERYQSLNRQYVRNVDAVLFVFDLNKKETFKNIKNWIKFFNDNFQGEHDIPKYLIGNKKDLKKDIDEEDIYFFKEDNEDFIYKETSAKEEDNQINDLFQDMGEILYNKYKKYQKIKTKYIKLAQEERKDSSKCAKCIL